VWKEGTVVYEKEVCFQVGDVINEEWNRRTLRGDPWCRPYCIRTNGGKGSM
jgi:hypothetical protein